MMKGFFFPRQQKEGLCRRVPSRMNTAAKIDREWNVAS